MKINSKNGKLLGLLFLSFTILVCITSSSPFSGFASPENNTLMQPQEIQNMSTNSTNATNIVLVHGGWADGTGWNNRS